MTVELLSEIEVSSDGCLYLKLNSEGDSEYQHIYREGKEVCWCDVNKAFKSPVPQSWSYFDWYKHICEVTLSVRIILKITNETIWKNVSEDLKEEILGYSQC